MFRTTIPPYFTEKLSGRCYVFQKSTTQNRTPISSEDFCGNLEINYVRAPKFISIFLLPPPTPQITWECHRSWEISKFPYQKNSQKNEISNSAEFRLFGREISQKKSMPSPRSKSPVDLKFFFLNFQGKN